MMRDPLDHTIAHPHDCDRNFIDHLFRVEYGLMQCPTCKRWGHDSEFTWGVCNDCFRESPEG